MGDKWASFWVEEVEKMYTKYHLNYLNLLNLLNQSPYPAPIALRLSPARRNTVHSSMGFAPRLL